MKSASNHIQKRANIRSTWGSVKFMDEIQFSTIFLIGKTQDAVQQALIDEESARYADILHVDIVDKYM